MHESSREAPGIGAKLEGRERAQNRAVAGCVRDERSLEVRVAM